MYGVDFTAHFSPLEFDLIDALGAGEVQVGVVGSTDGRLADESTGWVCWRTTRACSRPTTSSRWRPRSWSTPTAATTDLMDSISAALADLIAMNKRYDVDHDDAEDIAADWLSDNGFD